jgi:hypothetical protein
MTKQVKDDYSKLPNYNPNIHPWKVFIVDRNGNERQVRTYTTKEKAEGYALHESMRGDRRTYRIRKVLI